MLVPKSGDAAASAVGEEPCPGAGPSPSGGVSGRGGRAAGGGAAGRVPPGEARVPSQARHVVLVRTVRASGEDCLLSSCSRGEGSRSGVTRDASHLGV